MGQSGSSPSVCLTPTCVKAAAHVLDNLHPDYKSMDPCNDFAQYQKYMETLVEIANTNRETLRSIVEGPYPQANAPAKSTPDDKANFDKLVLSYEACMDSKSDNTSGLAGLAGITAKITQLFPIDDADYLSNSTITEQDYDSLAATIAYLSSIGIPVFGEFSTGLDNQNPDVYIPYFGFYAPNNVTLKTLPAQITIDALAAIEPAAIAEILNATLPSKTAQEAAPQLAEQLVAFSAQLANFSDIALAEYTADPDSLFYTTTIKAAAEAAPALGLDKVIKALAPEGCELDRMQFELPKSFSGLSTMISKTPRSTLQIVMLALAYANYLPYTSQVVSPKKDRFPACFNYLDSSLSWIMSKFFLDATYNEEIHKSSTEQTNHIRDAFVERIGRLDWLQDETKTLVQEKVKNVILEVGYPDKDPNVMDPSSLKQFYAGVNITTSHFANVASLRQWSSTRVWQSLTQHPADRERWPEYQAHSWISNAQYVKEPNQIAVPAAMSQPPLAWPGAPRYLSYGSAGYIQAHELTHALDTDLGLDWDPDARYRRWWDNASAAAFKERAACFVDEFSRLPVLQDDGTPLRDDEGNAVYVNGTVTLAENVADSGGLGLAFEAWRKLEDASPSPRLPGLEDFTNDQLFFLAFGQTWCQKIPRETLLSDSILANAHSPPFPRILGTAANTKAFRDAFQCKKQETSCELW
ncbi:endothelin-converting enzyme [Apiospora marii]|uniref:Endothelin-converting enzyme n=1 Tax=Apiospora marii TaxID=335849 RepID=A0ABR1RIK7_9PEZI